MQTFAVIAVLTAPATSVAEELALPDSSRNLAETTQFSPEVERKLAKVLEEAAADKKLVLADRMQKVVADLQSVTKLNAEGAKELQGAADTAIEEVMRRWPATFSAHFRKEWDQLIRWRIDVLSTTAPSLIYEGNFVDEIPEDQPVWIEGLRRVLTPEQAAIWTKAEADRRRRAVESIDALLAGVSEEMSQSFRDERRRQSDAIKRILKLPKAAAEQLDDLAKGLAAETYKQWREYQTVRLLTLDDDERSACGHLGAGLSAADVEKNDRAWNTGLAALLSPDDLKRWQDACGERRIATVQAFAALLVAEMDRLVAFDAEQRRQIEPLAALLVERERVVPGNVVTEDYRNGVFFNPFNVAARAHDFELAAILDARQQERWRNACDAHEKAIVALAMRENGVAKPAPRHAKEVISSPEADEQRMSDFLSQKCELVRSTIFANITLKEEDLVRSARLAGETRNRMINAAKGSADVSFAAWKEGAERQARDVISGALADQSLEERLDGLGASYFDQEVSAVEDLALWNHALEAYLTEAQRGAWKSGLDARKHYFCGAIAQYLLTRFSCIVFLNPNQQAKLGPLVTRVIETYEEDLSNFFARAGVPSVIEPWYVQESAFLPIAELPQNEIQAILTPGQMKAWKDSEECQQCDRVNVSLKRMQEMRLNHQL